MAGGGTAGGGDGSPLATTSAPGWASAAASAGPRARVILIPTSSLPYAFFCACTRAAPRGQRARSVGGRQCEGKQRQASRL